jgi:NTE family protein
LDKKLVFALSGGGARGALQVGALYALLEYGLQPDLVIGVSIGAANATHLAIKGFSKEGLDELVSVWQHAKASDLLPTNYIWLTVRAMFGRSSSDPSRHLKEFLINNGITPDICFADIKKPQLILVSSDLNTGKPILHGKQPDEKILDALLLSTALPPWFMPDRKQGQYLMDGGFVSQLPIESALKAGATAIVALDLVDSRAMNDVGDGVRGFVDRMIYSVETRQKTLEMELAEARGVPLLYLGLAGETQIPIWDFRHTDALIARGYVITRRVIEEQRFTNPVLVLGSVI